MPVHLIKDAYADSKGKLCESTDADVATSIGRAGGRPVPDVVAVQFGVKGNPDYDRDAPRKGAKADSGPPETKADLAPEENKSGSGLTINKGGKK